MFLAFPNKIDFHLDLNIYSFMMPEELIILSKPFIHFSISRQSLSTLMGDLLRLIRVLYGSISDAFTNVTNHPELTSLLTLWQNSHSPNISSPRQSTNVVSSTCLSLMDNVQYLPTDSFTKVKLSVYITCLTFFQ